MTFDGPFVMVSCKCCPSCPTLSLSLFLLKLKTQATGSFFLLISYHHPLGELLMKPKKILTGFLTWHCQNLSFHPIFGPLGNWLEFYFVQFFITCFFSSSKFYLQLPFFYDFFCWKDFFLLSVMSTQFSLVTNGLFLVVWFCSILFHPVRFCFVLFKWCETECF